MNRKLLEVSVVTLGTAIFSKIAIAVAYYTSLSLPVPHRFLAWVNAAMLVSAGAAISSVLVGLSRPWIERSKGRQKYSSTPKD